MDWWRSGGVDVALGMVAWGVDICGGYRIAERIAAPVADAIVR